MTLGRLDYLYTPSRDVAADARYLVDVLGGELAFAIEDGGTRVAMVRFPWSPAILVTDHLEGDRPIQIHAVDDLETTATALEARGWIPERTLEVPPGRVAPSGPQAASGWPSTSRRGRSWSSPSAVGGTSRDRGSGGGGRRARGQIRASCTTHVEVPMPAVAEPVTSFRGFSPDAIHSSPTLRSTTTAPGSSPARPSSSACSRSRWKPWLPRSPGGSRRVAFRCGPTPSAPRSGSTATPGSARTSHRTRPAWVRASRGSDGWRPTTRVRWAPHTTTGRTAMAGTSTSSPARCTSEAACGRRTGPSSRRSGPPSETSPTASGRPSRTRRSWPGSATRTPRGAQALPAGVPTGPPDGADVPVEGRGLRPAPLGRGGVLAGPAGQAAEGFRDGGACVSVPFDPRLSGGPCQRIRAGPRRSASSIARYCRVSSCSRARTARWRRRSSRWGLQTQYAPSGYVGLWTRVAGFERDDLTRALEDRTLVQASLMRTTIHVVSRREYCRYAMGVRRSRQEWAARTRLLPSERKRNESAERLRDALRDGPKTVKELGELAKGLRRHARAVGGPRAGAAVGHVGAPPRGQVRPRGGLGRTE